MNFADLVPPTIREQVASWIAEDMPSMDIGGFVVGTKPETAHLLCKSSCTLAGIPFAQAVFDYFGLNVEWKHSEGDRLDGSGANKIVTAIVKGPCKNILMAERNALNILSRASGVATAAATAQSIAVANNWKGLVAGTRKTTPGFRSVEKYALIVGGIATHRDNLSQMVMLKDNHIWSAGSITAAVKKAQIGTGFSMKIEVECQSQAEAEEACEAGAHIVMLDNFTPENLHIVAENIKAKYSHVIVEASGGITQDTMHLFMGPHIDVISRGSLTQGYPCCDFSLKIQK
jgi:nicotinate-nucleotide pyrophosphorylase (carboxylating)